jgi:hypothetical protein
MSYYESLISALVSVVPNEKSATVVINKISQALVHITNQIDSSGASLLNLRPVIVQAFETTI